MAMTRSRLLLAFALLTASGLPARADPPAQSRQDVMALDAEAALRRMSKALATAPAFMLRINTLREVRLPNGQPVLLGASTALAARRPDHLVASVGSDLGNFDLWYDGRRVTLLKPIENIHAASLLTGDLQAVLDWLEDRIGIQIPVRPIFAADPYAALLEAGPTTGFHVGRSYVQEVEVDHFALRNPEASWEIRLEANDRALPRRVSVVQPADAGPPRVTLALDDWNLSPQLADGSFSFVPPPGAVPATPILRPE